MNLKNNSPWAGMNERGNRALLALMLGIYRHGGRRLFHLVLVLVIAWYWAFAHTARQASLAYLRRLHDHAGSRSPFQSRPTVLTSYRHLLAFGDSLLDKIAGWLGELPGGELRVHGREHLQAQRGKGALLIGAHFGNLELLRAARADAGQAVNVLVHTRHAEAFNRFLQQLNPGAGARLLQVTELGPESAIVLSDKLAAGEWLLLTGDRTPLHSSRLCKVPFLGQAAAFPEGPMWLAGLLKCPVLLLFCYRVGNHYEVHIEPFRERLLLPRGDRAAAVHTALQEYATRLEAHCLQAPLQWFNFHDFWAPSHDCQ